MDEQVNSRAHRGATSRRHVRLLMGVALVSLVGLALACAPTPGEPTTTFPSTTSTTTTSTTTTSTTSTTLPSVAPEPGIANGFQNNAAHTGSTSDSSIDVASLTEKWGRQFFDQPSYAVIARDKVFVTAKTAAAGYGTTLFALDLDDGSTLWSVDLGGTYWMSSVAYEDGRVFALNYGGRLHAFDEATGWPLWQQQLSQRSYSAPVTVRNNYVYAAGSGSGGTLDVVNAMTGGVVFSRSIGSGSISSPAVDATGVYSSHPCDTQGHSLFGALLWRLPSSCTGGGGKQVTLDSANHRLYVRGVSPGTRNMILDSRTGAVGVTIPGGSPYAISADAAFTVANGVLVKVDPLTGSQVWSMGGDANETLVGPPNIVDGVVIVGGRSGKVYGISATNGARVWTSTVGAPVAPIDEQNVSQPTAAISIGLGHVVVPTDSGLRVFAN